MAEGTRFRRRIAERRARAAAGLGEGPLPSEEDDRNLASFQEDAREVTALLREEIAAIHAGRLDSVTALFPRKAALLKRIELLMPVVEPFLKEQLRSDRALADRLSEMKAAVREDCELIERMSLALADVIRDIEKIRNRHSLDGIYEKSGRRVTGAAADLRQIDKTI